jgi:uncharacterized RDD family membrane protein YckC
MAKYTDIRTTQNVVIQYEIADLRDRIIAYVVDLLIMLLILFFLLLLVSVLDLDFLIRDMGGQQLAITFPFMLFWGYHILFEMLHYGQTWGKQAMGIRVVRLDGKNVEWSDALLRALLHLADSVFCMGIVGCLLIQTTARRQRLGDMAAHTMVIKLYSTSHNFRLQDLYKSSKEERYTPQYPQVKVLTEKDMIFIKSVLDRRQLYRNHAHDAAVEDLVTHLMPLLGIAKRPNDRIEFLKTLIRDYLVLTR